MARDKIDASKPVSRSVRKLEGWMVRVDDRLLEPPHENLGSRILKALERKLADINAVVRPDRLEKLHAFTIVLDMSHGKLRTMQYHPSAEWLEENGYARDLAHCVHIPVADDLLAPRQINVQPWCVLHELAHAYHDQVLGFDEPRIRDAYAAYKKGGHGANVLVITGERARHYALTDHKEFFAEMTESYFGVNDFFPFNRAELKEAEPDIYRLLVTIWGPVQTERDFAKSKPSAAMEGIHQWHPEVDPEFGETAGKSFLTVLKHDAHELDLTLEETRAWEPTKEKNGGRRKTEG